MWIPGNAQSPSALPLGDMQTAQMLMVAGFVMLGWVLIRRQLRERKRVNRDARSANKALQAIRDRTEPAVPLCDAPPETQRWQVALFDLQRELKAELDTRVSVIQAMMRQLDERIERISCLERQGDVSTLAGSTSMGPAGEGGSSNIPGGSSRRNGYPPQQFRKIFELASSGQAAADIAAQTGIPLGDVELMIGTKKPC